MGTQALLQNAAYVQDEKLRLMMIRGSHYQPSSAARLFERFLATKLELFGKFREKMPTKERLSFRDCSFLLSNPGNSNPRT